MSIDSGWPTIPPTWKITKLKHVARLKAGESITSESMIASGAYPVFGGNGVRGYANLYTHEGIFALIGRQGALCGNVNYTAGRFWASEHAVVVSPLNGNNTFWLGELLRSMNLNQYSQSAAQPGLSVQLLEQLLIPVPPVSVQRAIADYLRYETTRLDSLVAAKEQLIELVGERVRLLAHELTTQHGEPIPLRRLVKSVKTGTTPPVEELRLLSEGAVPWYSPSDVQGWLRLADPGRTLKTEAIAAGWVPRFPPQATLIVGIGATAGKVAFLSHPASGNQQMTCLVPGSRLIPRFLAWQLFARSDEIRATAPFTTLPIINNEFLRALVLIVPPLATQAEAVKRLDGEAATAQMLAEWTEKQTGLLHERRQALVTAAVTGRIDIPGAA